MSVGDTVSSLRLGIYDSVAAITSPSPLNLSRYLYLMVCIQVF